MAELKTMYPGAINSKATSILGTLGITTTIIEVLDGDTLPDAPNLLVLGGDSTSETILMTRKVGNTLTVERAIQGIARTWENATLIARNFTEKDYASLVDNIEIINSGIQKHKTVTTDNLFKKVDKLEGKGLSANDYTDGEKIDVAKVTPLKSMVEELIVDIDGGMFGEEYTETKVDGGVF